MHKLLFTLAMGCLLAMLSVDATHAAVMGAL